MPCMNEFQFGRHLSGCYMAYRRDNDWFYNRSVLTLTEIITNSYRVYERGRAPALGMILLGDTKLRANPDIVANFGYVADSDRPGAFDEDASLALNEIDRHPNKYGQKRELEDRNVPYINALTRNTKFKKNPLDVRHAELRDGANLDRVKNIKGSILTANTWHPAMNDSLILGGGHGLQEMIYTAATPDELSVLNTLGSAFKASRRNQRAPGAPMLFQAVPPPLDAKDLWRSFFLQSPTTLWRENKPRVLARELLGLMMLEYKCEFSDYQLAFRSTGSINFKRHEDYLAMLRELAFQNNNRRLVMTALSRYLFNDDSLVFTPSIVGVNDA